jgi:hypothetical protein
MYHVDVFGEVFLAQRLGDEDCPATDEKGDRRPGASVGRIVHRIWVDGTEFRWTREVTAA